MINELKSQGRQKEISEKFAEIKQMVINDIPKDLAYVTDDLFDDYIHDMKIMQEFADINRKTMMEIIINSIDSWLQYGVVYDYAKAQKLEDRVLS